MRLLHSLITFSIIFLQQVWFNSRELSFSFLTKSIRFLLSKSTPPFADSGAVRVVDLLIYVYRARFLSNVALCLVDRASILFSSGCNPSRNQFNIPGMNHCYNPTGFPSSRTPKSLDVRSMILACAYIPIPRCVAMFRLNRSFGFNGKIRSFCGT